MNKSSKGKKFMLNEVDEETEDTNIDGIKVVDNHIYFYYDITIKSILDLTESIKKLSKELLVFNIQYSTNIEIYLHINSDGGDVFAVLSIINLIENNTININTIGVSTPSTIILNNTTIPSPIFSGSYNTIL